MILLTTLFFENGRDSYTTYGEPEATPVKMRIGWYCRRLLAKPCCATRLRLLGIVVPMTANLALAADHLRYSKTAL